jgi:hypothetical protein
MFSNFWNNFYSWISRANQVLATIDNPDIVWTNASVKDNLKGQALFLRAYSYWWLTQLYGDACIHLEPVTSVEEASVPLSPRADIIDIVVTDATAASGLLPNKAGQEAGRVTSGAAKMLLAEVAIWEKDYPTAETLLKSLAGEYSLLVTTQMFSVLPQKTMLKSYLISSIPAWSKPMQAGLHIQCSPGLWAGTHWKHSQESLTLSTLPQVKAIACPRLIFWKHTNQTTKGLRQHINM